jgi:proline dehydrogenase
MTALRTVLLEASENPILRRLVTRQGWARDLALRFVAGETLTEGLAAARTLAGEGKRVTLDYLGESVNDPARAREAAEVVLTMLERIGAEGLPAGVSVKPTQMGLGLGGDPEGALARELLGEIAKAADTIGAHLTLDMEASDVTEATVSLVEDLIGGGCRDVGCAVQSYLYRTRADVARLSAVGASLRLCKGTYDEPPDIAYPAKMQVDASFDDCAAWLLEHGTYPRIATHDHRLIARTKGHAGRLGVGRDAFEFQMLYGVRTQLQDELVRDGYRLCVYVPFGSQWYPYFMRRLAERPANLVFFLRALRG